jgi:hypothetical protein
MSLFYHRLNLIAQVEPVLTCPTNEVADEEKAKNLTEENNCF